MNFYKFARFRPVVGGLRHLVQGNRGTQPGAILAQKDALFAKTGCGQRFRP
jgi:hypothetical protein